MKKSTLPIRAVIFAFTQGFISQESLEHLTDNPEEIQHNGNHIIFETKSRNFIILHCGDFDFIPVSSVIPDSIGG